MKDYNTYFMTFILSGLLITGIKYLTTKWDSKKLSVVLGGIPTGLIAMYVLKSSEGLEYSKYYLINNIICTTTVALSFLLFYNKVASKNDIVTISILFWIGIMIVVYVPRQRNEK